MDCSPPGSSVPGIFQARVLEWGVIAFSGFSYTYICNTFFFLCILFRYGLSQDIEYSFLYSTEDLVVHPFYI